MHFFAHCAALRSAVAWPLAWWMCQKIQRAHNFVGNCILFLSGILFIGIFCCSCLLVCCILFGVLIFISFLDKRCENCCNNHAGQSVSKLLNLFAASLASVRPLWTGCVPMFRHSSALYSKGVSAQFVVALILPYVSEII